MIQVSMASNEEGTDLNFAPCHYDPCRYVSPLI